MTWESLRERQEREVWLDAHLWCVLWIVKEWYMTAKILLFYSRYLNSVAINSKNVSTDYMRETILYQEKVKVKVTQSYPTLCEPMDYTVHGILQARMLEWVAVPFSRGSSQTRDWTQVSHIAGGFFTSWATRKTKVFKNRERVCKYSFLLTADLQALISPDCLNRPKTEQDYDDKVAWHLKAKWMGKTWSRIEGLILQISHTICI